MQDSPSSAKGCLSLMMMQTPVRRVEEEAGGGRAGQGWGHGRREWEESAWLRVVEGHEAVGGQRTALWVGPGLAAAAVSQPLSPLCFGFRQQMEHTEHGGAELPEPVQL